MGNGRGAMGEGQWAMGEGQWAMGEGQWARGDGRWAMGDGLGMYSGECMAGAYLLGEQGTQTVPMGIELV
jgi:hypothetical protein